MNAVYKPRKRVIAGIVIVLILIAFTYATAHNAADYVGAAGALCLLWSFIFDRPPDRAKTIGDVYRSSRAGWHMSTSSKAMILIGIVMITVSGYMKYH